MKPTLDLQLLEDFLCEQAIQPATALWRAAEIGFLLTRPFPGGRGMDLGCGNGWLTRVVLQHVGPRVMVGVDPDPREARAAQRAGIYASVHVASGASVPEDDGAFDFVFSNSVLEHIPELHGVLAEAARVLRPGGELVATVPSERFHGCLRGPRMPLADRGAYRDRLDRQLQHRHYLSPAQWSRALDAVGLDLEEAAYYLPQPVIRRWEDIVRWSSGLLYRAARGRKAPIEMQRQLGLRGQRAMMPRSCARALARVLTARLDPALAPAPGEAGAGLLVRARRRGAAPASARDPRQ